MSSVDLSDQQVANLAASFQEAVVDCLVNKSRRALEITGLDTLCVGGGVAANQRLRVRLEEEIAKTGYELHIAPPNLCTDNAVMGGLAVERFARRTGGRFGLGCHSRADSQLTPQRWPVVTLGQSLRCGRIADALEPTDGYRKNGARHRSSATARAHPGNSRWPLAADLPNAEARWDGICVSDFVSSATCPELGTIGPDAFPEFVAAISVTRSQVT